MYWVMYESYLLYSNRNYFLRYLCCKKKSVACSSSAFTTLPRPTTYAYARCFDIIQVTRYFGVTDYAACNALTSQCGVRRLRRRPQNWVIRPPAPPENVAQNIQ